MDIKKDKIIIMELIPTNLKSNNGVVIQLSALKLDGLKLLERFDYRLKEEALPIPEMKDWINYDNESFNYVDSEKEIFENFDKFIEDIPILIIDNEYTKDYIKHYNNEIHDILKFLNYNYTDDVISNIMNKYNIEPTDHIVDILYEALMMEY